MEWSIAGYSVIEKLGEGGFGVVFRVTKEQFALKILNYKNATERDSIETEIANMTNIGKHPNVLQLINVLEVCPGQIGLLLEYCNLGDLDHYMKAHPETPIAPLMGDMIAGLKYLHENNLAHRDLKPPNILLMLMSRPICKLSDFGLSKFVYNQQSGSSEPYLQTICGTESFMAPEILLGKPYTTKCDIYSLGLIFYALVKASNRCTDKTGFHKLLSRMLQINYTERANIHEVSILYHEYGAQNLGFNVPTFPQVNTLMNGALQPSLPPVMDCLPYWQWLGMFCGVYPTTAHGYPGFCTMWQ